MRRSIWAPPIAGFWRCGGPCGRACARVANGERLNPLPSPWPDGVIPTYGHDTVLEIPPWHGDESERLDALRGAGARHGDRISQPTTRGARRLG